MFPVNIQRSPLPNLRQTDNMTDRYDTNLNGNYRYQSLVNSMSSSDSSINIDKTTNLNQLLEPGNRLVKSTSDQKLPDDQNAFYYVNKNGHAVKNQVSPPPQKCKKCLEPESQNSKKINEILCNHFLVELANSKSDKRYNNLQENCTLIKNSEGRPVPSSNENSSINRSNLSDGSQQLVQRENNGELVINTSLTIQEPNIELTSDHVKYINLFSILCCWCFPITGILSIIYARLTTKYYNKRDLNKAKKYLKCSEWMLIATFFFGFTLIAVGFAFMEHFFFKSKPIRSSHFF